MIGAILGILLTFLSIVATLYLWHHFFPRLSKIWVAALIAAIVLGIIRALHGWLCNLLCGVTT